MTHRIKLAGAIQRGDDDPLSWGETPPVTGISIEHDEIVLDEDDQADEAVDLIFAVVPIGHPYHLRVFGWADPSLVFTHEGVTYYASVVTD